MNGRSRSVSNPCLVELPDGRWRLYYSAGLTALPDCGFSEPTYIGVAESVGVDGPFQTLPEPVLGPADGPASLSAGAIKVLGSPTAGWGSRTRSPGMVSTPARRSGCWGRPTG